MAKPNEINDRIDNGYMLKDKEKATTETSQDTNNSCINYCCKGDFLVPLKEFEHIIYSNKFGTNAGKIQVKQAGWLPYAKFFWRDTIAIVDTRPKTINYNKKSYIIKDQFEAEVNAYVTYQIIDVENYYESSQNALEELNQKVQRVLRGYFVHKGFEELNAKTTSLKDEIGSELNQTISNIGIRVTDIGYTECKMPKTLIDDAEQKKAQELAHHRQEKELKFQQAQTKETQLFQNETMDPLLEDHKKNEAGWQANAVETQLKAIRGVIGDFPPEDQARILEAYLYANSNNNNNNIHIIDSNAHKKK